MDYIMYSDKRYITGWLDSDSFYGIKGVIASSVPGLIYNLPVISKFDIPDGITTIGDNAFNNDWPLLEVTIPDSVTKIGSGAFKGCTSLTSINIPDGVTSIGNYTFQNCWSLTSVTIPKNVTTIGREAFKDCSGITNITIPKSVTSIDTDAFSGCTALTDVYYFGTKAEWEAIEIGTGNEPLTNATIHYNS